MVQYGHNVMGPTQTPSWMMTFKTLSLSNLSLINNTKL